VPTKFFFANYCHNNNTSRQNLTKPIPLKNDIWNQKNTFVLETANYNSTFQVNQRSTRPPNHDPMGTLFQISFFCLEFQI